MEVCKLCLEEKILLKQSHIIPEFLYEKSRLYNAHHKFVETDTFKLKDAKKSYKPLGEYEQNILCKTCDNIIIGQTEDYAKRILFDENTDDFEISNGIIKIKNVEYNKFKLFLLSILWRSSISSRPFFNNIKLDKRIEEELRTIILKRLSTKFNVFPTMIATSIFDKDFNINVIIEPYQWVSIEDGMLTGRFFIGDYIFLFKIGESTNPCLNEMTLTEDNVLKIIALGNGETAKVVECETGINVR